MRELWLDNGVPSIFLRKALHDALLAGGLQSAHCGVILLVIALSAALEGIFLVFEVCQDDVQYLCRRAGRNEAAQGVFRWKKR